MTLGRELNAKLFLEGIEVPLIGATVTSTVSTAAIAYVDVVPHATLNDIKPRTLVHIFVKDYQNPDDAFPYILMFEGEVFGFSFSKTPSSRSLSLSCIDYSSYWDNALIYFFNPMQSLGKGAEEYAALGMTKSDIDKQGGIQFAVSHSIASYYLKVIDQAGGDLLDGLVKILKDIKKINEFYSYAEQRTRTLDRIVMKSSGNLESLLRKKEARDWFEGIVGRNTGYQTLRMVVQDMMSLVFHDNVTIPFPAKVNKQGVPVTGAISEVISKVVSKKKKKGFPNTSKKKGKKKKGSTSTAVSTGGFELDPNKTIGMFVFKPNLFMLPPPACNIFYPDEYSSYNYNRNFFQEPTRLIYQPELPVYGSGKTIKLKHAYAPDSFAHFMGAYGKKKKMPPELVGKEALQVDSDRFGNFGDKENNPVIAETNNKKKKEQQFLTNEERMKGFLLTNETMVPATSQFREAISEEGNRSLTRQIANYIFFKKRFQGRELQITSHLKPSVVPGFTVMVLDDSEAEQTVIAYCNSVTHRIYATQGGYTNVQLSYARTIKEQDITSKSSSTPLVPPWFSAELRGTVVKGEQIVSDKLSIFYETLLGAKGSKTICGYTKTVTATKAYEAIKKEYMNMKAIGPLAVHELIRKVTCRSYVTMTEAFSFIGAKSTTTDPNEKYMEFKGIKNTNTDDLKKDVIRIYRDTLKFSKRGFRG